MISSKGIDLYPIHKFCKRSVSLAISNIARDPDAPTNASLDCSLAILFYHAYVDIYAVDTSTINHEAELPQFTRFLAKFTDVSETLAEQYRTHLRDILPFIRPADSVSGCATATSSNAYQSAGKTFRGRLNYYLDSEFRAKEWKPTFRAVSHIRSAYGPNMVERYVEAIRELRVTNPYDTQRITRIAIGVGKLLCFHFPSADLLFGSDNHAWENFIATTRGLAHEPKTHKHSMLSPRILSEVKTVLNVFVVHGLVPVHAALITAFDRDLAMFATCALARRLERMTHHYAQPISIRYLPPDLREALHSD